MRVRDPAQAEHDKYEEMWAIDHYRLQSPGLGSVPRFAGMVPLKPGGTLIDFGCGDGRAGLRLRDEHRLDVWWLDITDAGLVDEVPRDRFMLWPVWGTLHRRWDYGYCVDVLEHLPTEYVALALDRMLSACGTVFFSVALRPDEHGVYVGQPLHLTVRDFVWWRNLIGSLGELVEARDLCDDGIFVCTRSIQN